MRHGPSRETSRLVTTKPSSARCSSACSSATRSTAATFRQAVQPLPMPSSGRLNETVQDLLRARFLELDVELVAVDGDDAAIAELLVEDPLADREIGLVAFDCAAVVERLVAPARAAAAGDAQALVLEAARLVAQAAMMTGGVGG